MGNSGTLPDAACISTQPSATPAHARRRRCLVPAEAALHVGQRQAGAGTQEEDCPAGAAGPGEKQTTKRGHCSNAPCYMLWLRCVCGKECCWTDVDTNGPESAPFDHSTSQQGFAAFCCAGTVANSVEEAELLDRAVMHKLRALAGCRISVGAAHCSHCCLRQILIVRSIAIVQPDRQCRVYSGSAASVQQDDVCCTTWHGSSTASCQSFAHQIWQYRWSCVGSHNWC